MEIFKKWKKRYEEREKIMVLVYDTENGETTNSFIKDVIEPDFDCKYFKDANDNEKNIHSIIAVVRHTTERVTEILNEVKGQFDKEKFTDLERVFVIYLYVNKQEENCVHKIKQISDSRHFNFAKIVPMKFVDKAPVHKFGVFGHLGNFFKSDNEKSLQELKDCILSREKVCVNVYGAVDSLWVNAFIAELDQYISSWIKLQAVESLEKLINKSSPTIICTTGDVDECLEKIKEKDLKNVFLVHIVDVVKRSEIDVTRDNPDNMETTSDIHEEQNPNSTLPVVPENNTSQNTKNTPCEIHEILDYHGKIITECALVKKFETFVADGLTK